MSKITQLNERSISVEVPADATNFSVQDMRDWEFALSYNRGEEWEHIELPNPGPNGPFVILGRPEEITEDQWKGIVEMKKTFGYSSYGQIQGGSYQWYAKATDSGLSLLKSKGLQGKSIIILQKQ